MEFESHERRWRWIALLAIMANIAFSYLIQHVRIGEGTTGEISARYPSLFTPADYAFTIWGLIYLTTFAYAIHQLLPSQRSAYSHDALAAPLVVLNALGMAWLLLFQFGLIGLSVAVIAVMLGAAIVVFTRAAGSVTRHELSKWVLLPTSLWFGWLSVAFIANASLWTVAMGWTESIQFQWTLAMIAIATLLGLVIGYRFRNWIYPLVIAWAGIGIWFARKSDTPWVAAAAMASAVMMIAWAGYSAFRARRDRSGFRIFRGPIDVR